MQKIHLDKIRAIFSEAWTFLTAGGVILAAVVLVFIGLGADKVPQAASDADNMLRILAGLLGVLLVGVAGWAVITVRSMNGRADIISGKLEQAKNWLAHAGDEIIMQRDQLVPWSEALRGRSVVKILGMSLRSLSFDNIQTLNAVVRSGGECTCILLKPESAASAQAAKTYNKMKPADYDREIALSTDRLLEISGEFPQNFTVKQIEHIPIAGMTYLEGGGSERRIIVELYTMTGGHRPHLDLSPGKNEEWFQHFYAELNALERGARTVPPNRAPEIVP